jgi:hypothetical protein
MELEELIRNEMMKRLAQAPEPVRRLGKIIRRSVRTGQLHELRRFFYRHGIRVRPEQTARFRDHLILERIDLKDLEPAARARLRTHTLASDDASQMTDDYRLAIQAGDQLYCRSCRWFVTAPQDGSESGSKSCVELGTKGADVACYGYTAR